MFICSGIVLYLVLQLSKQFESRTSGIFRVWNTYETYNTLRFGTVASSYARLSSMSTVIPTYPPLIREMSDCLAEITMIVERKANIRIIFPTDTCTLMFGYWRVRKVQINRNTENNINV